MLLSRNGAQSVLLHQVYEACVDLDQLSGFPATSLREIGANSLVALKDVPPLAVRNQVKANIGQ